jgi:ADP-ribose pyrophosphatase YjhB (NUDIX family)
MMMAGRIGNLVLELQAVTTDPSRGLPEELFLYVSRITPLVNVDLLIRDKAKGILLTWRDDDEYGAGWHVPGGIIRFRETFSDRIHAVAHQELGASVAHGADPIAINQIISPTNAIRGHFISLLFDCELISRLDEALAAHGKAESGQWAWHKMCPPDLIVVHNIYRSYFQSGG